MSEILVSGMQPTNQLTLGNYLGALKNWCELQEKYECYFFAVDLHSITTRQDPQLLAEQTRYLIATYLAAGIDPKKCALFVQSHVHQHAELAWVLNCFTYMGELNRMTQFKDKSGKQGKNIPVGLFTYPALMASDILLYDANLVPVGADQKQHLELTRDLAERLNGVYGEHTLIVPKPYIAPVGARIMSLQDPQSKMSKSDPNENASIFLNDTDKKIEKKLKRAVTDSGSEVTASPDQEGVHNLLTIQSVLTGKTIDELVAGYQGKQYGHLKVETAEIVTEAIRPLREKTEEIVADRGELDRILKIGAERAAEKAAATLARVYERLGFIPRPQ